MLKPAETTPLTALLLAEIIEEADLPPGVVNIVTGAGATGAAVVGHPGVDKVAFTGSTEVGKRIQRALAGTGKKLTLELGGKAANIVFEDAPLDQAVEGIINGIFFNQGHVCCAGSRLLVEESVHDELLDKLKRAHGDAARRRSARQEHRRRRHQLEAQLAKIDETRGGTGSARGARASRRAARCPAARLLVRADALHGRRSVAPDRARGDLRPGALGPDLPHARGGDREGQQHARTACRRASGPTRAPRASGVAQQLRAGVVWANTFNKFDPTAPFGGYKESGFGREGGRQGLLAYLEVD